jgi:hypothetical protein
MLVKHKQKNLLVISLVLIFTLILSACDSREINVGNTVASDGKAFSGYTSIEIEENKYNISKPVTIDFYYGHDIDQQAGDEYYESIQSFKIEIVLTGRASNGILLDPDVLYDKAFTRDEFSAEEYRCSSTWKRGDAIEFKKSISFGVDFSSLDYSEGYLDFNISQVLECESCEDESGFQTNTEISRVDFEIEDDKVFFEY